MQDLGWDERTALMRNMDKPLPESAAPPPGHVTKMTSHGSPKGITVSLHSPSRPGVAKDASSTGDDAVRNPHIQQELPSYPASDRSK